MNTVETLAFMAEARHCAMEMDENATYIERELPHPNVRMSDPLRAETAGLCARLLGTKDDIIRELNEMDPLANGGAPDERLSSRMHNIIGRIREDIIRLHGLVKALEAAADNDPACGLAFLLVSESATNIVGAYNRIPRPAGTDVEEFFPGVGRGAPSPFNIADFDDDDFDRFFDVE